MLRSNGEAGHTLLPLPTVPQQSGTDSPPRRSSNDREGLLGDFLVMVADHEHDVSVKSCDSAKECICTFSDGEITSEDVFRVRLDGHVPVLNERLVHLRERVERSIAVLDSVRVPKVRIREAYIADFWVGLSECLVRLTVQNCSIRVIVFYSS